MTFERERERERKWESDSDIDSDSESENATESDNESDSQSESDSESHSESDSEMIAKATAIVTKMEEPESKGVFSPKEKEKMVRYRFSQTAFVFDHHSGDHGKLHPLLGHRTTKGKTQ